MRRLLACLAVAAGLIHGETYGGGLFVGKSDGNREVALIAWQRYNSQIVEGYELESRSMIISLLRGEALAGGEWVLTRFDAPGRSTGTFRGAPGRSFLTGEWQFGDGRAAVPVRLRRTEDGPDDPRYGTELLRKSEGFAERAFRAAVAKRYGEAVFFLKLYRLTNKSRPFTDEWEGMFEAAERDELDEWFENVITCQRCPLMQEPLAYVLQQRQAVEASRRLYRTQCRNNPQAMIPPAFTCLMYASLNERIGDVAEMKIAYDLACPTLPFACKFAFGPEELKLIAAIEARDEAAARRQLAVPGINVNSQKAKALWAAVIHAPGLVGEILRLGADPNLDDSILKVAITNRRIAIARMLLDHGADPNLGRGGSALFEAVAIGDRGFVEELIRRGADVNYNDFVGVGTPLTAAAESNDREMVKLLLRHGADPADKPKFHEAPIDASTDPEIRAMIRAALQECVAGTRKCESNR